MGAVARGLGVIAVAMVVSAVPANAQEDSPVRETGMTEWEVRPNDNTALVDIQLSITNTGPATIDRYGVHLPMEPDTVDVDLDGTAVDVSLGDEDGFTVVEWDLGQPLVDGATQTWHIKLQFDSAPPRTDFSEGPRITNGYVAVPIWAWGFDDATLVVRVPQRMAPRLGVLVPTVDAVGWSVFTARDAGAFSDVLVGAADGTDGTGKAIAVGDTTLTIQAWSDDPQWGAQVGVFAARALPTLAAWTSTPWDGDEVTIRETATPEVEGWGGWNDPTDNVISVGEEFDAALWTHELSHNWFNHAEFTEPWLIEGLAQAVTVMLADDLDVPDARTAPARPPRMHQGLLWWDVVLSGAGTDVLTDPDAWYATTNDLYDTSHYVIDAIATEIGEDAFREVVGMTLREESAWGTLGTPVATDEADWREFLDLAERTGGSATARDLLLTHVATDAGPELRRRDRAVAAFDELAGEPMGVPAAVRTQMHHWRFDEVDTAIARARTTRADIEDLATRAADLGLPAPDLSDTWDTGSFDRLDTEIGGWSELFLAVEDVQSAAAAAELPRPVPAIDPADDDPQHMAQVVSGMRTAVTQLAAAEEALAAATGPLADAGMIGTDPDALRERARAALAEGDVGVVATASRQLGELAEGATTRGLLRIGGVVLAGLAALALVVTSVVWLLRRRRRDLAPAAPEPSV